MKIETFDKAYALLEELKNINYFINLMEGSDIDISCCNKHVPVDKENAQYIHSIIRDELQFKKFNLEQEIDKL